jgi:CheY-like chemotaxis protein
MRESHDGATTLDPSAESTPGAAPLPWRSSSRLSLEQLSFATTDGALALADELTTPQTEPVVLIAESDPALAALVRDELRTQTEREALIACDSKDALDLICQTRPQVVLFDPELTGMALPAHVRAQLAADGARLIFLTSATSHDLYQHGVREGLLLRKPYDPRDLAGIVRALLDA